MKTTLLVTFCVAALGCAVNVVPARTPACPPLPELAPNATRQEGRVHWLTVIELYKQCAASQR